MRQRQASLPRLDTQGSYGQNITLSHVGVSSNLVREQIEAKLNKRGYVDPKDFIATIAEISRFKPGQAEAVAKNGIRIISVEKEDQKLGTP
ncbi:hypothetical protein HA466_0106030 [Hirschfeldia incana]|nr:hypothetical protein HA466_0106030 [Hirschfeldia incana]